MLIERVRRALAPDYEVLREVAAGGMGIVFAAYQPRLDRTVAIKILRPETATAVAAERFLAEGQLLARLSSPPHPNIVPVFDAGEADGLLYYVMEYVKGETLADRLKRGALPPREALDLARDLLAALSAAHAERVIHRDVKPANIFLRDGRALLGDFGIARWRKVSGPGLTKEGEQPGTPSYMAPEQHAYQVSTARTDVYSAGLVIYEACTGQRWPAYQAPEKADWHGVPPTLLPALRRALAIEPAERWTDAHEFAAQLEIGRGARRGRWIAAGLGTAAVAGYLLWPRATPPSRGLLLDVVGFEVRGAAGRPALGDSMVHGLVAALTGYADLQVRDARKRPGEPGALRVTGIATLSSRGAELELDAAGRDGAVRAAAASPAVDAWPVLVADLADTLIRRVWQGTLARDRWLPRSALPRSAEGLGLWHAAEQLYAQARWEEAADAYAAAEGADSTCLLCSYRLLDIGRWLAGGSDSARLARISRGIDSFPPTYRALIEAQRTPWPGRYDILRRATERYPDFYLAAFMLGDELFHRGPLYGHLRREALEPLQHALQLRPDFAPGYEHLGWLLLSEGTAAEARRALDSVPPERAGAGISMALREMLVLGYRWRFGPPAEAMQITRSVLREPVFAGDWRTPMGGRVMMTTDSPTGAVGLGGEIAALGKPEAVRSGLLAQAHGYAALGRLESLRAVASRLRAVEADPSLPLYVLELEGALVVFDPDTAVHPAPELIPALERYTDPGAEASGLRRRAAWMLALLAVRSRNAEETMRLDALLADEPPSGTLRAEVETFGALVRGDTAGAGRALARLPPSAFTLDNESPVADDIPVADAALRLLRAEYLARTGRTREAREELRWTEHLQLYGYPTGGPQSGEAAWALGTLVRWRRASLLDTEGQQGAELCATYAAVARLWAGGEPPYAARGRFARDRLTAHRCAPQP
jgi:hypothetical protein